jgi:hypothetical protein
MKYLPFSCCVYQEEEFYEIYYVEIIEILDSGSKQLEFSKLREP